ncbi:hypothetical protein [uncultured Draconibacterium sp.]|uniref:hypothetical protein n=1 Tax=uncultured Draconibacterium sp. TaxID=1573823 RepID=UPI003216DFD2
MHKQKINPKKPKDVSRFNRWLKDFDEKDKSLNTGVRKRKWMLIIGGIFLLFILSFILFPASNVKPEKMDSPFSEIKTATQETSPRSAFELPVDSFENQLKRRLYEDVPEKE